MTTPKTATLAAEDLYTAADAWVETVSGSKFEYANPVFDIGDIAHALGNVCRFTGHCQRFYSVAEHSVLVSRIMEQQKLGDPMEGLMHDATEAYLADVASPIKALLKDYQKLEKALEKRIRQQFELPAEKTEGCIRADWLALMLEANKLLPSKGKDWKVPEGIRETARELQFLIQCWTPADATSRFMDRVSACRRLRGLR